MVKTSVKDFYAEGIQKIVFDRKTHSNEWKLFQNFLPKFSALIPASFPLVEASLRLLFLYGVKLHHLSSINALHIRKYFLFSVAVKKILALI